MKCIKCLGQGKYSALGGMTKDCELCEGKGYKFPLTNNDLESIYPDLKIKRKKRKKIKFKREHPLNALKREIEERKHSDIIDSNTLIVNNEYNIV